MKLNKNKAFKYLGMALAVRFFAVGYTTLESDLVDYSKRSYKAQILSMAQKLGYNLSERVTPLTINEIIMREIRVNELNPAYGVIYKALIFQESTNNSYARSEKDARGLGQVLHSNAKYCGYKKEELYEDEKNLICGIRLFSEALKNQNFDLIDALKEYHASADRSQWGEKTTAYPRLVLKRLKELK